MKLINFLIVSSDANGENTDLVVTATLAKEALVLWRAYYDGWDLDEKDIRVFALPDVAPEPKAHEWPDADLDTRK